MSTPEPVPPSTPPADQLPPGFSPNGHPAPTAQLMQQLPQMLFQAVAAAFQKVPVTVAQPLAVRPLHCATCRSERLQWGALHQADIAAADQAWRAAVAEMESRAPEDQVPIDPAGFIPGHLRAGAPPVDDATVMIGGTLLCDRHIPGVQQGGGRKEFLIANAPLSSALIAEVMGQQRAA